MRPVESYLSFEPRRYPWLAALTLTEAEGGGVALELAFRDEGAGRLLIACTGVRSLRFTQPRTSDMKLHWLDVTDVRDRQMEGIAFEVVDFERDWLSFTAATLDAHIP